MDKLKKVMIQMERAQKIIDQLKKKLEKGDTSVVPKLEKAKKILKKIQEKHDKLTKGPVKDEKKDVLNLLGVDNESGQKIPHNLELPGAQVSIYYDFFEDPPTVKEILKEVVFNTDEESRVMIYGKYRVIPRKQTAYGDAGTFYRFTGNKVDAKSWDSVPTIVKLKNEFESVLGLKFNFVLVNYYEDGGKKIGWHSDDLRDLKDETIVSVSFGATRDFLLKEKKTKKLTNIPLPNNSLLVMGKDTQKNYLHSVPERKKIKEGRLNLTFRILKV